MRTQAAASPRGKVLLNPTYAKLFSAQVVALLGTGLTTVALGLLAFEIAGGDAGAVLGIAMTIKMVAYVVVSPLMTALAARLPRTPVLVGADLTRASIALMLPFVSEAWQIYVLIFVLQSASATFTPTFQALIPAVLPDQRDYTRALSYSRLAYDLESLVSPMIAAALLTVMSFSWLFVGTAIGFVGSAALVIAARPPSPKKQSPDRFRDRLTEGVRVFWARPELRGLLWLNLAVATSTAMIIVNTVVVVQRELGRTQADVALLLAATGGGSLVVALSLPSLLERWTDRRVMLIGAFALPPLLVASAGTLAWLSGTTQWIALLVLWALMGAAAALILTPTGRLIRRNSSESNMSAVFAAQFSLSHACYLMTYPIAGVLGVLIDMEAVAVVLAVIGVVGAVGAAAAFRGVGASRGSAFHGGAFRGSAFHGADAKPSIPADG